jgi:hypothetical protein
VKKLITFLSVGDAVYALLIGLVVSSVLRRVHDAQVASGEAANGLQLLPLTILSVITPIFIILFASLAVLLVRHRARGTSLIIAGISCFGTILGGLTIYALTRPDVVSEFTPAA